MDCPLLHSFVPLVHVPVYGIIQPTGGCLPPDQGVPGMYPSMALRDGQNSASSGPICGLSSRSLQVDTVIVPDTLSGARIERTRAAT